METEHQVDIKMQKNINDIPLSESNVSLKLADIQRRCAELLTDSGDSLELTLEEPVIAQDGSNPYDLG
jgi:hypothetical protein